MATSSTEIPPSPKRQKISSSTSTTATTKPILQQPPIKQARKQPVAMPRDPKIMIAESTKLQSAREAELGITCYVISDAPGFAGTLKQRFTDFQVREISIGGKIVTLCDDAAPDAVGAEETEIVKEEEVNIKEEMEDQSVEVAPAQIAPEVTASPAVRSPIAVLSAQADGQITEWFGEEGKVKLLKMFQSAISNPHLKSPAHGRVTSKSLDRDARSLLHDSLRQVFERRFDSSTNADESVTVTVLPQGAPRPAGRTPFKKAKSIFSEKGEFLYLSLYKENKDTMEVTNFITKFLKIKPKDIGYAGTKDRRAATTQRISIRRQTAERLSKLNATLRGAYVGNFSYHRQGLELGELEGNLFVITLRDVDFGFPADTDAETLKKNAIEILEPRVKNFKESGFINYFGLQRFGTHGIGTDVVGLKCLKGDFEGAVNAILSFDTKLLMYSEEFAERDRINRDDASRAKAISEFKRTGSTKYAQSNMPRRFGAEMAIINHLAQNPKDFLGALLRISRGTRTMYVHAYQSLVWNAVASERYRRHGAKVVKGDLVLVDTQAEKAALRDEVDENGEVVVHPAAHDLAVNHDDIYQRARALTAEEAASGKYTIFDVVLPTPGFDVNYPDNEIGDYYKEFMFSERGGGIDPANMRRAQKDFSLSGSYRTLMGKVSSDMTFEARIYYGSNTQLVETDLDKFKSSKPEAFVENKANAEAAPATQNRALRSDPKAHYAVSRDIQQARGKAANGVHSTALASWANAAAAIKESDQLAAAASEAYLEKSKVKGVALGGFKDTWQATSEDSCKVTGEKEVTVIKSEDQKIIKTEEAEVTPCVNTAPIETLAAVEAVEGAPVADTHAVDAPVAPSTPILAPAGTSITKTSRVPAVETPKRGAEEISTSTPASPRSYDGTPEPARLAVILSFSLGTSQYATMALRELMRSDGVRSFQPDYFSGRRA